MSQTLITLIVAYGYPVIFLGGIFEGESVILIGGLAAHEGYLSLPLIYIYAVLGAIVGDTSWFFLGRWKGEALLLRWPIFQKFTDRPVKAIHKHPRILAFAMRFMYGFRHIVPFSLGFSSIPTRTFLVLNLLGALVWAGAVMGAGYLLGGVLEDAFGNIKRMEFAVISTIVLVIAVSRGVGGLIGKLMKEKIEK